MSATGRILAVGFLGALTAGTAAAQEAAVAGGVDPVALVSRWTHILAAVVMLGGAVFIRLVLLPSVLEVFGEEGHKRLRPVLMKRWQKIVHASILLFLVSGFYNYMAVTMPRHQGDSLYHALFGVKFLLAMAVFALASMLISTRERESKVRANAPLWMAVTIALAVIVVLIGGYMKLMP